MKADIVVINEFTVPTPGKGNKNKGTRGGTPGDYVLRYMARANATESLAPIRKNRTDDFIERYMAREQATETLEVDSVLLLKRKMAKAQGQAGVAFGHGQVSLSHDALKAASRDIQSLFDDGHTVMKTVLSFDEDYLKKHGIVPKGFKARTKGDYRGRIDQMKLRLAIMNGLDRMGRMLYDDLRYVAVIQVDTMHVHCHVAMVDAGVGTLAPDGTQKGKITDRAKSLIRRGIDGWLDEKQQMSHLSSAVGYERRNVATFVKKWAHQQMLRESLPQFLLACLPSDKRMWRYSTNAKAMQKPNRLVREIVEEALAQPGSPYPEAMARVRSYANSRRRREGLSKRDWQRLIDQSMDRIIERGVNGVYGLLRALPADALRIKTPMLDVMGLDYEEMAARAAQSAQQSQKIGRSKGGASGKSDDLIGFGFRLRSYSSRLRHHILKREEFHARATTWEAADAVGAASPESRVMHVFFREEEEYHARVAAKYRSLLNFMPASVHRQADIDEVTAYGERLISMESLRQDQSLRKMKDPQQAERLGRDVYGQAGGALVAIGDKESLAELDRRIAAMRVERARRVDVLRMKLAGQGFRLTEVEHDGGAALEAVAGVEFPFEGVKTLDLHHMRFDFARDVEVGPRGRGLFASWADRRRRALQRAVAYLEDSGQHAEIQTLPVDDIARMGSLAESFDQGGEVLPSEVSVLSRQNDAAHRSRTVQLGVRLRSRLEERVSKDVRELRIDELGSTERDEPNEGQLGP
ncbi:relaxase MobL [Arthrobacter bambusae]|uniref:relaxase MobL n=1 Tax=Arthrobacter bambusae TaxID=1338426 RepID=UPI0027D7EF59|nr:relaxase MobL [Arthrobacter bambusae]